MDYKLWVNCIRRIKTYPKGAGKCLLWLAEQYIEECLGCVSGGDEQNRDMLSEAPDEKIAPIRGTGKHGRIAGKRNYYARFDRLWKIKKNDPDEERFPNVAGFCRYMGISTRKYNEISAICPEETGQISAAFEDEALNSDKPAAIIGAYLKARLGWADAKADKNSSGDEVKVVFEHDVLSDGE